MAGKEAANLLEALGTPHGKAERKVRKEVSRNRRFAEKALEAHGGNPEDIHTFPISRTRPHTGICGWKSKLPFRPDAFRNACLEMSHAAILGRARALGWMSWKSAQTCWSWLLNTSSLNFRFHRRP
ncbi:tRNA-dependent cyclodipeptide synthase [Bacillus licheniformis]|nr:tRNA-dependent cyclodipeptide synthase [Bacillus licheniformis]